MGTLRPPSHGRGLILYGNPGNRGGGRTPDAAKAMLATVLAQPEADAMIAQILRGESFIHKGELVLVDGDLFLKTYAWAHERAYGKVAAEPERGGERKPLTIRLVHEVRSA